jgi:hypothetical protein
VEYWPVVFLYIVQYVTIRWWVESKWLVRGDVKLIVMCRCLSVPLNASPDTPWSYSPQFFSHLSSLDKTWLTVGIFFIISVTFFFHTVVVLDFIHFRFLNEINNGFYLWRYCIKFRLLSICLYVLIIMISMPPSFLEVHCKMN